MTVLLLYRDPRSLCAQLRALLCQKPSPPRIWLCALRGRGEEARQLLSSLDAGERVQLIAVSAGEEGAGREGREGREGRDGSEEEDWEEREPRDGKGEGGESGTSGLDLRLCFQIALQALTPSSHPHPSFHLRSLHHFIPPPPSGQHTSRFHPRVVGHPRASPPLHHASPLPAAGVGRSARRGGVESSASGALATPSRGGAAISRAARGGRTRAEDDAGATLTFPSLHHLHHALTRLPCVPTLTSLPQQPYPAFRCLLASLLPVVPSTVPSWLARSLTLSLLPTLSVFLPACHSPCLLLPSLP